MKKGGKRGAEILLTPLDLSLARSNRGEEAEERGTDKFRTE